MKTEPKSEPQQMSDEEIHHSVLEHLGWTGIIEQDYCDWNVNMYEGPVLQFWQGVNPETGDKEPIPPLSLDLLHEAEKTLTDEQHYDFRVELWAVTQPTEIRKIASLDHNRAYASATARQRALAFIQAIDQKTNP